MSWLATAGWCRSINNSYDHDGRAPKRRTFHHKVMLLFHNALETEKNHVMYNV